jgi:ubiquinone/menaquinone biosynthesis C-methylase UbiE
MAKATFSEQGYDRLAAWYEILEQLAFGDLLMQARVALLRQLPPLHHILVLGEGDGRFLKTFLTLQPHCQVVCLEQSSAMIAKASSRLNQAGLGSRVQFLHGDFVTYQFEKTPFDMIVTTFVLDMFDGVTLRELIGKFAASLKPKGYWYYADFQVPAKGFAKQRARAWLTLLYTFFRWQTDLPTRHLVDPRAILERYGLTLLAELDSSRELLATRLYQKSPCVNDNGR